ncbi:methyl-accepting chemotaxis protein [Roseibium hamelinense]|uniref:Methyl-accepting chemotaxis protein n=1 Tax=Roseibium hamelinense TaxID=150831 RepID=A0A562TK83_9HYPH|nr:HAMP domain-containing methyl-accepting chemotaxis protein [Roseibium hamelinense]MTI42052.1 hypothetical protein [Roseibium hamelinense]TWI93330.1 methyl-accepting chemotaxis protein [Roseibium hamelinense]
MSFDDMKIRWKITLGMLAVFAAVLVLGGKMLYSLDRITQAFSAYQMAAHEAENAVAVKAEIQTFVGLAKEYVARNTEARYEKALQEFDLLSDAVGKAAEEGDGRFAEAARAAQSKLAPVLSEFKDFSVFRQRRNDVVETELPALTDRVTSALEAAIASAANEDDRAALRTSLVDTLRAKDHMNRYMFRFNEDELERARTFLTAASDALPGTRAEDPRAGIGTASAMLDEVAEIVAQERGAVASLIDVQVRALLDSAQTMTDIAHDIEEQQSAALLSEKTSAIFTASIVFVLAVVFAVATIVLLDFKVAKPLRNMVFLMGRVAREDPDVTIPDLTRKDEIGDIARALADFDKTGRERRALEEAQLESRAQARRRQDEMDQMVAMFGKSVTHVLKNMRQASEGMGTASKSMLEAAKNNVQQAENVSDSVNRTAESSRGAAAAAEEMSSSIEEIGSQISRASTMSSEVADVAEDVQSKIEQLSVSADQISQVVDSIRAISEQTNLLALNATIEAARAGEAGKGFAVVASEVKQLANQTTLATEEVSTAVTAVRASSDEAIEASQRIKTAIDALDSVAQSVASATVEQQAATGEIARAVQTVSQENDGIMREVDGVRVSGSNTRSLSEEVGGAASLLSEETGLFSDEVMNFLDGLGRSEVRESIERHKVNLQAVIADNVTQYSVTISEMTPAAVLATGAKLPAAGARVTCDIPGLGAVRGRVADITGDKVSIQLPLDTASVEKTAHFLKVA